MGTGLDFRNVNMLWASVLAETLSRLGLTNVVICPGSRSGPLAIAFAQHPTLQAISILDERSAAFFALGLARRTATAVALICSSGTAGANVYPAVIEARESRVPLLILTADRPPELRACNAGQTIDQQKLYGTYPALYQELSLPSAEVSQLAYLRQTLCHAWERAHAPVAGVVHLNCPFRDPLYPALDAATQQLAEAMDTEAFFRGIGAWTDFEQGHWGAVPAPLRSLWQTWLDPVNGLPAEGVIVAGPASPPSPQPYCEAIAHLSMALGYPVLAEGLSPLRNFAALNPSLVSTYDLIVRRQEWAKALAPKVVIRVGETPTSKALRHWLQETQPMQWVVDGGDRNLDPLHLRSTHLPVSPETLASTCPPNLTPVAETAYQKRWRQAEHQMRQAIDAALAEAPIHIGSKVAWIAAQVLPPETPIFIANSLAVREVEWFWQPGDRHICPQFNRGANGIDGTLSTALGMAHDNRPSVLLTGDLALLHDTNGFLIAPQFQGHLTILLVNNEGGGIFQTLPIANFDPPFESFFATPQAVDWSALCAAYGIRHIRVQAEADLRHLLKNFPETGIRLLEVRSDRTQTAAWLQTQFRNIPET